MPAVYAPLGRAIDAYFERLGLEATYKKAGGPPVTIRVIARRPNEVVGFGETRFLTETAMFDLWVSEIDALRPGYQLTLDEVTHEVQGGPVRNHPDRFIISSFARG